MVVSIRVDVLDAMRKLEATPDAMRRAIEAWLPHAAQHGAHAMAQHIENKTSPRATGNLKNHALRDFRVLPPNKAEIGPEVSYAEFVDQPTQAHDIRPRNKKALAFLPFGATGFGARGFEFKFGGRKTRTRHGTGRAITAMVVVKSVRHPGTKGLFFIDATRDELESSGDLERLLETEIVRHLQEAG